MTIFSERPYHRRIERLMTAIPNFKPRGVGVRFTETQAFKAMYYLHLAAEHGNQYAAQLIHSIKVNGNWTAALASLRLLGHMARILQNRLEDERRGKENSIDRKLRKKIEEKKQAQGLRQG